MTPEEKAVIDAAMEWHYAILANPSAIPLVPMSGPALALEGISHATWQLVTSCPECNAGGHTCPGDGKSISHTATGCGEHGIDVNQDMVEANACGELFADNHHISEKNFNGLIRTGEPTYREWVEQHADASTYPCWECLVDPTEDPRPWCDCRPEDSAEPAHPYPCRLRAHAPESCLNRPEVIVPPRPTEAELNIEVIKTGPNTETHILSGQSYADITSFPPEPTGPPEMKFGSDKTWEPATLLYCLAGDRIRIGQDETDVLRSSSGAWHAQVVSSVLPSGKTWDKVTPWEHTELRLDLSANPGFQEYPPNLPCEILCTLERLAILHLMQGIPGTTVIKR